MKQEVKAKQDNSRVADIVGTLVVLNRDNFVIDAGREFQEVVDGIIAINKPGELIIKLKLKPSEWDHFDLPGCHGRLDLLVVLQHRSR